MILRKNKVCFEKKKNSGQEIRQNPETRDKIKIRMRITLVILSLIFLGALASVFIMKEKKEQNRNTAYIYKDKKLVKTIDLSEVEEPYDITIKDHNGEYNVIRVMKGKIGVIDASCPDKLCKKMGFISDNLLPVTCLPNHVIIEVLPESEEETDNKPDGIAY